MKSHKIDKILVFKTEAKSDYKYPLDVLSVNDRFWVNKDKSGHARAAVQRFQNRDGTRFSTRLVGEKLMIWRVA